MLANQLKKIWINNKPFLVFIALLLVVFSFIKIIFYYYNRNLLFGNSDSAINYSSILKISKWSVYTDLLLLLPINLALLLLLQLNKFFKRKFYSSALIILFTFINSFAVLLNLVDIFYYKFHNQRATADFLYVLDSPLQKIKQLNFLLFIGLLGIALLIVFFIYNLHKKLVAYFDKGSTNTESLIASFFIVLFLFLGVAKTGNYFLPTYPLTKVNSKELIISQNSAHTFIYSVFRKGEELPKTNFYSWEKSNIIYSIKKRATSTQQTKKNIVLFIMESVPYDFFDSTSTYFTKLPFFSTLLQKSTFFKNAYCFSHESNKGIVAILGGIPTLTDIPIYHSAYTNMPITKIGNALKQQGYKSIFCIGDNYDDFGFAKCTNWLGFDNYYSKENLSNYKILPSQAMGVHDEYVLNFMKQKINELPQPFLSVNFNISTHYDYELPKSFTKSFEVNYSTAMKSMVYYDYCLNNFFEQSKNEPWFKNTIFIFCSDHWMFPNEKDIVQNNVANYKIPIIIYDASNEVKKTDSAIATQFDILPSILDYAGYNGELITYGNSLLTKERNNIAISKINPTLYQIIDSSFALGFNTVTSATEYLYNYKKDKQLKNNLKNEPQFSAQKNKLEEKIKAILQKTILQYGSKNFN